VLLSILTTQTSAIAQPVTRAQMAVILGQGIHGSNFTPPAATGIFDDVSVNDWGANWIEQFYKDGITGGCGTNPLRYCPSSPVTRAEMAVFLLRAKHGSNYIPPAATGIFDDVPVGSFAADWIEELYNEGITGGCGTSPLRYCPSSPVTLAQMAVFIVRTFGLPAPVPKTGQTESYASGDDGDLQKGVQWPDPRFTDNGDGTVTDHLTSLIWLKNANCFGDLDWDGALDASNNLADGQCGLSDGSSPRDWRLPNVRELYSLIDHGNSFPALPSGHPFTGVMFGFNDFYWASTTLAGSHDDAWNVRMTIGSVNAFIKGSNSHVWPVRGGN
jgi:hypothetical protein